MNGSYLSREHGSYMSGAMQAMHAKCGMATPPANTEFDGWCRGLIAKHPVDVLAIMSALCAAGLARGEASANDLAGMRYSCPHAVGAAFKLMKRIGFRKTDRIVASTRPASHASFVLVWRLEKRHKAERFVAECRSVLLRQEQHAEQELLAI